MHTQHQTGNHTAEGMVKQKIAVATWGEGKNLPAASNKMEEGQHMQGQKVEQQLKPLTQRRKYKIKRMQH